MLKLVLVKKLVMLLLSGKIEFEEITMAKYKYNEYDLLELFESEPKQLYEEDVGIYTYSKEDQYGFTFIFYLSIHEGTSILSLLHKDLKYPIFDLTFHDIEDVECKENRLI